MQRIQENTFRIHHMEFGYNVGTLWGVGGCFKYYNCKVVTLWRVCKQSVYQGGVSGCRGQMDGHPALVVSAAGIGTRLQQRNHHLLVPKRRLQPPRH